MSNKKPAFLFYPGDWLRDTGVRQLSPREKGVYIELLIFLFDNGGYAALSMEDLMCTLNFRVEKTENVETSSVEVFGSVIERLLKCGVIHRTEDGRLYNRRILRDLETKDEVSQKRSEAGKRGAMAKWQNDGKAMANGWQTDGKQSEGCHEKEMAKDGYSSSSSSSININTLSNAREAKLPTSEAEAVAMCAGIGVPDDFITSKAYPRALAVGFVDRGSRIVNWPQWVKNYWCASDNSRRREQSKPQARVDEPREVIHLKRLN